MAFKINISHQGKTIKIKAETEDLIGKMIGSKILGDKISLDLKGYEIEITGTSDNAGFPGLKEVQGQNLKKVLLKRGKAMSDKRKGLRLRKTVRGNTISQNTVQINCKVLKQGKKKFEDLIPAKKEEGKEEKPAEEKEEKKQADSKENKEQETPENKT
jgi:small subunit ribosomal protein S6e